PQPIDRTFRLDAWIVRPDSNELHAVLSGSGSTAGSAAPQGEVRSLEPRLMQLLCLLAAAPHRVFTRDELMSYLWPRVVVNDNSLTRAVSELRKKLASDAGASCIDTIPKSGYRLSPASQVEIINTPANAPLAHSPTRWIRPAPAPAPWQITPRHPLMSRLLPAGAVASMILGLLVVSWQMLPQGAAQNNELALADVNLTNQAAVDALIDGKFETVAAQGTLEDLVDTSPDATPPVVSRDGELFAYIHYDEQGSSLMLGSTHLPDSPITVFTTPDTLYNLQWSPLDRALLFAQSPKFSPAAMLPLDDTASLVLFDLDTFTTRVLKGSDEQRDSEPREGSGLFKLTSLTRNLDWLS
ncbi:MAG: winged helix-turn-helix domain-containing protein, partial [Pseudomonas sp.]